MEWKARFVDGRKMHFSRGTGVWRRGTSRFSALFSFFRYTAFLSPPSSLNKVTLEVYLCERVARDLHFPALRLASFYCLGVSATGHDRAHPGV